MNEIRVIVNGAAGAMGKILCGKIDASECFTLAGAIDIRALESAAAAGVRTAGSPCPLLPSLADYAGDADVLIDFSNHAGTEALLSEAVKRNLPVIICTTGHTEEERQAIISASEKIPVFFSANMSVGVALLTKLVREVSAKFSGDAEIVETHHRRKLDAPSGTALTLAKAVQEARPGSEIVCGRAGQHKRTSSEIGVQSVRMGNIAGIHEVFFGTDTETITLKHEAHDRGVFADGALDAARFLVGKPAGLYNMNDLLGE